MKGKEIFFLDTREDLIKLISFIESSFNIKYVQAGLLDQVPEVKSSLLDLPDIGLINHKDWNFNKRYLLLEEHNELNIRKITQKKGGFKYGVDQLENKNSLILSLGGYNSSEDAIIASKITTISKTEFSNSILKEITKYIKQESKKSGRFYVSSKAINMNIEGTRLTEDARLERINDITP